MLRCSWVKGYCRVRGHAQPTVLVEWALNDIKPASSSGLRPLCSIVAGRSGATRLQMIENQTIPSFIKEIATTDETRRNNKKQVSSYSATILPEIPRAATIATVIAAPVKLLFLFCTGGQDK